MSEREWNSIDVWVVFSRGPQEKDEWTIQEAFTDEDEALDSLFRGNERWNRHEYRVEKCTVHSQDMFATPNAEELVEE